MAYILDPARKDSRVKNFTWRIMDIIGKMYPIPDREIEKFISRILAKDISKLLYEKEGSMNSYEERIINEIGNMPNIAFWHRNIERKGFKINGFVNHYPDFILYTKSGKTILLETRKLRRKTNDYG
jgi:type III restriction enzyme